MIHDHQSLSRVKVQAPDMLWTDNGGSLDILAPWTRMGYLLDFILYISHVCSIEKNKSAKYADEFNALIQNRLLPSLSCLEDAIHSSAVDSKWIFHSAMQMSPISVREYLKPIAISLGNLVVSHQPQHAIEASPKETFLRKIFNLKTSIVNMRSKFSKDSKLNLNAALYSIDMTLIRENQENSCEFFLGFSSRQKQELLFSDEKYNPELSGSDNEDLMAPVDPMILCKSDEDLTASKSHFMLMLNSENPIEKNVIYFQQLVLIWHEWALLHSIPFRHMFSMADNNLLQKFKSTLDSFTVTSGKSDSETTPSIFTEFTESLEDYINQRNSDSINDENSHVQGLGQYYLFEAMHETMHICLINTGPFVYFFHVYHLASYLSKSSDNLKFIQKKSLFLLSILRRSGSIPANINPNCEFILRYLEMLSLGSALVYQNRYLHEKILVRLAFFVESAPEHHYSFLSNK